MFPELTQQQRGLLEQCTRAHAAWVMAVNHGNDAELGTAYAAALGPSLPLVTDDDD